MNTKEYRDLLVRRPKQRLSHEQVKKASHFAREIDPITQDTLYAFGALLRQVIKIAAKHVNADIILLDCNPSLSTTNRNVIMYVFRLRGHHSSPGGLQSRECRHIHKQDGKERARAAHVRGFVAPANGIHNPTRGQPRVYAL